uniref:Uncharacterized protein n=1 Tax=Schizaphis graminum TaxID=13262 RepID=A0A2S2PQV0_SCHGA
MVGTMDKTTINLAKKKYTGRIRRLSIKIKINIISPRMRDKLGFRLLNSTATVDGRSFSVLPVPFGAGKYDVHPHSDRLAGRRRQVKRPLSCLYHERATLSLDAVRVVDVHFLNVLKTNRRPRRDFLLGRGGACSLIGVVRAVVGPVAVIR